MKSVVQCQTVGILVSVFVSLATDTITAAMTLKKLLPVKVSEGISNSRKPRKRKVRNESYSLRKKSRHGNIDQNKCSVCQNIYAEGEEAGWVGCDFCPRWFHKDCVEATINSEWRCSIDTCSTYA